MATIGIGSFEFNVLPETASWSYAMNIQRYDTFAGRVMQLLSCNVEKFSIEGYILPKYSGEKDDIGGGRSDVASQWVGMEEFEENVKAIMFYHEQYGESIEISFDAAEELGWSSAGQENRAFLVGYTDVRYEPDIPAAKYRLNFEVDSGFDSIAKAAGEEGLKSIPDGVGWVRNVYNTPKFSDWTTVKEAIGRIVDDAGTHDSNNPADFYTYIKDVLENPDKPSGSGQQSAIATAVSGAGAAVGSTVAAASGGSAGSGSGANDSDYSTNNTNDYSWVADAVRNAAELMLG